MYTSTPVTRRLRDQAGPGGHTRSFELYNPRPLTVRLSLCCEVFGSTICIYLILANRCHTTASIVKRYHNRLPSGWPGFDSRSMQPLLFLLILCTCRRPPCVAFNYWKSASPYLLFASSPVVSFCFSTAWKVCREGDKKASTKDTSRSIACTGKMWRGRMQQRKRTREITASSPSQHKGEGIAVAYEQIAPNNQIRRRRRGGRKNMSNAAYIPYNTNFLNGFVHLVIQTKKKE